MPAAEAQLRPCPLYEHRQALSAAGHGGHHAVRLGGGGAGPSPLGFQLTWLPCFSEKMVFVGFKGSFRPTWVALDTEDHKAKIFQVVPIPVVRKRRL